MSAGAVLRRLWRGLRERRAATAVLFALTVTPILGFVALAFDVGSTVWTRSQLDLAADAAALTGVMTGATDFAANPATSFQAAQLAGQKRFYAQASRMPGVTVASLSVGVTRSGGTITSVVSYTGSYKTQFARLFGMPTLPTFGTATITRTNSPFFDIEFLLDNSSSMAIAASQPDMITLGTLVRASPLFKQWGQGQNCAFGCHFDAKNNDFYGLAKSNGVPLRSDVLSAAVQNVITTISQSPGAAQFAVGLYSFNATFNTLYPSSPDLTDAALAALRMTVPVTTNGGDADTNIPLALQSLAATLPASGDGSTPALPRRYVFIVTDGVADYFAANGARTIAPLNPAQCTALKAKGIQVLVLYTLYVPLVPPNVPTANSFYVTSVANNNVPLFSATLAANLQACASSPGFYQQASDAASIQASLQTLLQAALSAPARFTQ